MAKKPTVYIDTNLISAMHYKGRNHLAIYRRIRTLEWWESERGYFDIFASSRVEIELNRGEYRGKVKSLAEVRRQKYLRESSAVREAAKDFLSHEIVPEKEVGDAVHLAFCTIHSVDYLLTWNHAHLANVFTQQKLDDMCADEGWRRPLLVTPESIPKVGLGQDVRRRE